MKRPFASFCLWGENKTAVTGNRDGGNEDAEQRLLLLAAELPEQTQPAHRRQGQSGRFGDGFNGD